MFRRLTPPWTSTVGLARTLMALSTGLILVLNPPWYLFNLIPGESFGLSCQQGINVANIFCLFSNHLYLVQKIAGIALLIISTGIYPRFTAPLHWFLTFCFVATAENINGGDQLASVLTLFLIPLCVTDPRNSHWARLPEKHYSFYRVLLARISVWLVSIQMCLVYFHAAVGKLRVPEWVDGSVMYYWIQDPVFGAPDGLKHLLMPFFMTGVGSAIVVWSVLTLEFLLAAAIIGRREVRPYLFCFAVLFHAGTVFIHGIPSFALVMYAGLIVFLLPVDQPLSAIIRRIPILKRKRKMHMKLGNQIEILAAVEQYYANEKVINLKNPGVLK